MNTSIIFVLYRAIYISPVPTIRTVKGRVVFFRAQREKISTLNPLTVRIFAAAFSPPKTGDRISKPCPRFRPLHFSGKTVCTCAAFTVGFCGASRPAPPTSNKEQKQPLQRRKACEYGAFTPAAASFPRWAGGFYTPCYQNAFQPSAERIFSLFLCLLPLNCIAFPYP